MHMNAGILYGSPQLASQPPIHRYVPFRRFLASRSNFGHITRHNTFCCSAFRSHRGSFQFVRRHLSRKTSFSSNFISFPFNSQLNEIKLSTLLNIEEKWLIVLPVIMMSSLLLMVSRRIFVQQASTRNGASTSVMTEAADLKCERVLKEIRRLELKTCLLNEVNVQGKNTFQGADYEETSKKTVQGMIESLEEIYHSDNDNNKGSDPEGIMSFLPNIDGRDWSLIYYLKSNNGSSSQDVFQYFIDFSGIEPGSIRQKLMQINDREPSESNTKSVHVEYDMALSLGSLGKMKAVVQGVWMSTEKQAVLTFKTIRLEPIRFVGREIEDDFLSFNLPLPASQQWKVEWKLLYLDDDLCIIKGYHDYLFLFKML